MGLDMYAYAVEKNSTQYKAEDVIAEWRKHDKLFSWMRNLYVSKNPSDVDTDFNCVPVKLSLVDLEALEYEVNSNCRALPSGAYVGYRKNHYLPEDKVFLHRAKCALLSGLEVVFMGDY